MRKSKMVFIIGVLLALSTCLLNNKTKCVSLANSISLIQYELELQQSLLQLPEIDGLSRGTRLQLMFQYEEFQEKYLKLGCKNYL